MGMMRRTASRLAIGLALVPLVAGTVRAVNPCRAACRLAKQTCLGEATAGFSTARNACLDLSTPAERRQCVQAAKVRRAAAKRTCRDAFGTCKLGCGSGSGTCDASSAGGWLATVNLYRGLAGLASVTERPEWSDGDLKHARYMVETDTIGHSEDPGSPFYTSEGDTAARNSNVAGTSDLNASEGWAVDSWMSGPFHAVGILDPELGETGFGIFHAVGPAIQTAAALDVIRGRTASQAGAFPVVFPADGRVLPIGSFQGHEVPDPLAACPGYTPPTGIALLVQFDPAAPLPTVSASTLTRDGVVVEHCRFDGTTYVNPDPAVQSIGRNVLAARGAVVLIPREPLSKGLSYAASLTADGATLSWSFTVDCP
ncbi:MAG: CAP domain-containing protein [Deltaproteobacteria bacterium]|nr:MAG: CAP domain-containing protein [Deltaproteobacteria bacterium]TMB16934.1 MAG: CAP domain-containing protein [Deltaproteobacteria bacterium]